LALGHFWKLWPTCDRSSVDVQEPEALAFIGESRGSNVNESSASSSQMRAPKPHLSSDDFVDLRETRDVEDVIAWDCRLYSHEEFIVYYGGSTEFVQCQKITDKIVDSMAFLLSETSRLTIHEQRLLKCPKLLCCRNKGVSLLALDADEELLILARSVYAPL
jgi:hypothetical protein